MMGAEPLLLLRRRRRRTQPSSGRSRCAVPAAGSVVPSLKGLVSSFSASGGTVLLSLQRGSSRGLARLLRPRSPSSHPAVRPIGEK